MSGYLLNCWYPAAWISEIGEGLFAGESRPVLRPGDEDIAARDRFLQTVAAEDFPMLQGIQEQMGDAEFWSLKPALLAVDAGAVMARRHLAGLIALERG